MTDAGQQVDEVCVRMRGLGCPIVVGRLYESTKSTTNQKVSVTVPLGLLRTILPDINESNDSALYGLKKISKSVPLIWFTAKAPDESQLARVGVYQSYAKITFNRSTAFRDKHEMLVLGFKNGQLYVSALPLSKSTRRHMNSHIKSLPIVSVGKTLSRKKNTAHSLTALRLLHFGSKEGAQQLLTELHKVTKKQHKPRRLLANGTTTDCKGPQAAGYTLEALLGLRPSSSTGPDYGSFEIKTFSKKVVTLLTTEADQGLKGSKEGFNSFMQEYGRTKKGRRSVRLFNGIHVYNSPQGTTKLTLVIENWVDVNSPTGACSIALRDVKGRKVAGWSARKMASHWEKKHANIVYVQSAKDNGKVAYGPQVYMCTGTKYLDFLKGMASGLIVYDPADSSGDSKPRRRSQWRLRPERDCTLEQALCRIYTCVVRVDL